MEITIPALGESITEGTIAQWLKKDGDQVREGEPVLELETEKATTELPSPGSGVLRIKVPDGKSVSIGAAVGTIEEGATTAKAPPAKTAPPPPQKSEISPAKNDNATTSPPKKPPRSGATATEPWLSPAARRLAREAGAAATEVPSGARPGVAAPQNVNRHLEQQQAPPPAPAPAPRQPPPQERLPRADREMRQPMSAIRQRIAERLLTSQKNSATLTTFNEADMSAIMDFRARHKNRFRDKHGVNLGFMSFFVKAAVEALHAFPVVNARIDQNDIVYHNYCNIGVAVSTEKGLMVPVVRGADRLGFAEIEKTIAEMAEKARSGKIAVQDLQGGTFTITNGGIFGSMLSTPILNPPQSAILGMHAIQKRPIAVDDQIAIRPMMYLALSYDHRLIDGRDAVLFLIRVKECIEQPERMLLEV